MSSVFLTWWRLSHALVGGLKSVKYQSWALWKSCRMGIKLTVDALKCDIDVLQITFSGSEREFDRKGYMPTLISLRSSVFSQVGMSAHCTYTVCPVSQKPAFHCECKCILPVMDSCTFEDFDNIWFVLSCLLFETVYPLHEFIHCTCN